MYEPKINEAPLPTPRVLKRRKNLLVQAYRFAIINLRMIRVIVKGH